MTKPLTVAIDARLVPGASGGLETVITGLAHGLSKLDDGDERYLFLVHRGQSDWLRPYLGGPCSLVSARFAAGETRKEGVRRALPGAKGLWDLVTPALGSRTVTVPSSDGTVERAGADVVHFPLQAAFRTTLPSIYHPHDLQHIHLPNFFSRRERLVRDVTFRAFCTKAAVVATTCSWVKRDLVHQYGLPQASVVVVPFAPVLSAYPVPAEAQLEEVRVRLAVPEEFIFYPAQTWPHKNHVRLLEALALLRDESGLTVSLVCSGRRTRFARVIDETASRLGIADQVSFLGFVTPLELRALYTLARVVVIPTLFEACSFPMWEAFAAGTAVAASTVTALPEQAGDAALLFDPHSPEQMASVIHRLWADDELREILQRAGRANVRRFSWEQTARHFRAYYRLLGGRSLTPQDEHLLSMPALL